MLARADDFDIKNADEFKKIIPEGAKVQKEASGFGFVEGPTWIKSGGGYLVFSDIPNNKIMKWTAKDGVTVFRDDSKNANGNTGFPGMRNLSAPQGGFNSPNSSNIGWTNGVYDWNDKPTATGSFSWVKGNHTYKGGAEWHKDIW